MLITRDIINKNIVFTDIKILPDTTKKYTYDYNKLSDTIDQYKASFIHKYKAKEGDTVLIGVRPSLEQTALFFACAELGMTIIVADYSTFAKQTVRDESDIDPKTKSLLPINHFVELSATTK